MKTNALAKIYPTEYGLRDNALMHIAKRPLSKHRRARLIAWTLAMLVWMAQVLFASVRFTSRHERQRGARMSLDGLTRQVKLLIISRAGDFVRSPSQRRRFYFYRGRDYTPRALIRAVIGSRVRRMLKRKAIGERIAVLIQALNHFDAYAALVAKRMTRKLTRRCRLLVIIPTPTRAAPATSLFTPAPCFADSS